MTTRSGLVAQLVSDDDTKWTGGATPENLQDGFERIKLLTDKERTLFNGIYSSLLGTEGVPKIADGKQIICKSKEFVKSLLLKHLTKTPKPYARIVGETISEFPKEYLFDPMYLDCLILEMIEDGTLNPLRIRRDNSKKPYPIGGFYNRKYLYKGEDMCKWYDFSVVMNNMV